MLTIGVLGCIAYYATGRGFDPRIEQTFMCMNVAVCIEFGCFLCIVCFYLQNKRMDVNLCRNNILLCLRLISFRDDY
jgi:hypothetical protein